MTTDTLSSRQTTGPASGRVADASALPARPTQAPDQGPAANRPADRIEVSEAARALQDQISRDTPPVSELPPARLSELLRRLNSGFYDKPEIGEAVLTRLTRDL